jgi:hypothetical protein
MIPRGEKSRNPGQPWSPVGTPLGYFPRDFRLERSVRVGTLYFLSWDGLVYSWKLTNPMTKSKEFRFECCVRVGSPLGNIPRGFRLETVLVLDCAILRHVESYLCLYGCSMENSRGNATCPTWGYLMRRSCTLIFRPNTPPILPNMARDGSNMVPRGPGMAQHGSNMSRN